MAITVQAARAARRPQTREEDEWIQSTLEPGRLPASSGDKKAVAHKATANNRTRRRAP
jgi:hypothetical protein